MLQFATAKHLYRIWQLFKSIITASDERLKALEKMFRIEDIGDDLLSVTDAEYRVIAALDKYGRAHFPVGMVSKQSETEGDHEIKGDLLLRDCKIAECEDYGMFYILDSEDHILFTIDREGRTDFKGIPHDIKSELDGIKERLDKLEK